MFYAAVGPAGHSLQIVFRQFNIVHSGREDGNGTEGGFFGGVLHGHGPNSLRYEPLLASAMV
jgi:hypothetical protein